MVSGDWLSNYWVGCRLDFVAACSDIPVAARDFEGFFTAHYVALTRLIYRVVGDIGCAEELAAEAFWKLHRNPPRSDNNLAGWLYRTGLRLALDNLKMRKRRAHYEALAPGPGAIQNPEEALAQLELRDRVRQVLAVIRREYAALLVLRSEGYSLGEMASILNLNAGSVGTFVARADGAFRKEYVNRYGER
jgi:RNA polymerase sigma factor (sigma-70 family)